MLKICEILDELRHKDIFNYKKQVQLKKTVGIIGVCLEAFKLVLTRVRAQELFATSGGLAHSKDDIKVFGIVDANTIMERCDVNWDEDHSELKNETLIKYGKLRRYF